MVRLFMVLALVVTALVVSNTRHAQAAQTTAPFTFPAHYMYSVDRTSAYNLGYNDGRRVGSRCGDFMTILDFGQVEGHGSASPGYGGYGQNTFANGAPFVSLGQVANASYAYQQGYWAGTPTVCATLKVVIGTNNKAQCVYHTNVCSPSGFGTNYGSMLNDLVNRSGSYSSQIYLWVGDDIETGYDSAARTRPLVDSFNANDPHYSEFIDYGDAASSSQWSDADIAYVAYGARFDYTLAQAFNDGQISRWISIRKQYGVAYEGILTEYGFYGFDPTTGWNHFWNALNNNGVPQSGLQYASNI